MPSDERPTLNRVVELGLTAEIKQASMARAMSMLAATFETIPDDFGGGRDDFGRPLEDARAGAHWLLEVAQTINEDPDVK